MTGKLWMFGIGGALVLCGLMVQGDAPTTKPKTDLGGAERYLTHLSTDKPIYKPGETLYLRGAILRADTHEPLKNGSANPMVEIKGPKGETVGSGQAQAENSVLGFSWPIPQGQSGGEYTIKVSYPWEGYTPAERKFDIRAYRAPRLKSQIVFLRDGYGPGDSVSATLHVDRAEGGAPSGAKVTATARVDGDEVFRGNATVDDAGNCSVTFKLPPKIARGEGTLALAIQDGGVLETAAKTIPILLQTVDIKFYPEGGDLVRGITQRVYFEARQPNGKPADLAGEILDDAGKVIAQFKTEHEGRGVVTLSHLAGKPPVARITAPAGIKTTYALPEIREKGVSLTPASNVFAAGQPLRFKLFEFATTGGKLTISKREKVVGEVAFTAQQNPERELEVKIDNNADGVLIATVWDDNGKPLAERLVYRQPAKQLNITVTADQSAYTPADKVTLKVTTTDQDGKPVGGVVGITVTDDSVLEMIEKREQAPRLPVMVLLENDVRELADAHVYLDQANPKAPQALDLLLGTQGWRRFALIDPVKFLAENGDAGRRVLALKIVTQREQMKLHRMARFGARKADAKGGAVDDMDMADGPMGAAEARPAAAMPARADAPPMEGMPKNEDKAAEKAKDLEQALVAAEEMADRKMLKPSTQPSVVGAALVPVREYAHQVRVNRIEGDRVDFAETIFWHAGVKTDDKTGVGTVSFSLSDAVTTFRVFADGFSPTGALGSASIGIESVQPFYIEPKIPLEVTAGDVIQMPVAMVSGLGRSLPMAKLSGNLPDGIKWVSADGGFTLGPKQRARSLVKLEVGHFMGSPQLVIEGSAGPFKDKVAKPIAIVPAGFPVEFAKGGLLAAKGNASHELTIPDKVAPGSVATNIAIYPTPLGNLTQALERLIQEPSGCFEQTSSSSYPLVMAQQYFLTHQGVNPKLIEDARAKLDRAYKRLTGFECPQKGYEWFGGDPGHEALTAYGLLQFVDMTQIREVDKGMIERTRAWLLGRRDGKGGFSRNQRALDSFGGAPEAHTNCYIVWALLEAGEKGIDKEVAAAKNAALESTDSYVIALGANIAAFSNDSAALKSLLAKLVKAQQADGSIAGATTSITRSGGEALAIETTALSVLAFMRDPDSYANLEKSMKWLIESCKSGRFGSTQSTILALRAIVNYDKSRARPKAPGAVTLLVDGKPIGGPVSFDEKTQGAIKLPEVANLLTPGKHTIALAMENGSEMPYSVTVNYYDSLPASSEKCTMAIDVSLRDKKVEEGAVTEVAVKVTNKSKDLAPTPVAIVGIPGGLEVRHDQLKELVKSGKIDAYEVMGRQVVLYWRALKGNTTVELPISLVAAIPGTYTAPASRTYLYYTDELKHWQPGMSVTITAK